MLKALEPRANISELAREHGISRKTAYKWLERFRERGVVGLEDLSADLTARR
ncbi:helix-turn-helix domain-containing protein [Nannocystis pusilla]|uniref:helix-turn-helix domain-containing protein n=1 Tax=Nannocystis pusilla TaxID=889268 RepID=UPI003B7D98F9